MLQDLTINLAAAAIAFILGLSARRIRHGVVDRLHRRRLTTRRAQRLPSYAMEWIADYYRRRGRLGDLYEIEAGGRAAHIPFLTRPSWYPPLLVEDDLLAQSTPHRRATVELNERVLRRRSHSRRERSGDNVWNDLHAVAATVRDTATGPVIDVIVGDYFQYLSVSGSLEDETNAAVARPGRRTPIRDAAMAGVDDAARCALGAHSIGMTVALLFEQDGRTRVLVQERSHSVSTYGGGLGVVPMFGCQTMDLSERTPVSLMHNFLREVYEELYGGETVERPSTRVDPRWFLSEPCMAWIVDQVADGRLRLETLGFGFDALNGQLIIGGYAVVEDGEAFLAELPKLVGNWEIRNIQVWDLFGDDLTDALLAGRFTPACAFTLARTRTVLARSSARGGDNQ